MNPLVYPLNFDRQFERRLAARMAADQNGRSPSLTSEDLTSEDMASEHIRIPQARNGEIEPLLQVLDDVERIGTVAEIAL